LLAGGMTPKDIAEALGIELEFAKQRLARARENIGVETNAELAQWAINLGLVKSDPDTASR
jgi:DNA-binding CsgD family transcriptional regulator